MDYSLEKKVSNSVTGVTGGVNSQAKPVYTTQKGKEYTDQQVHELLSDGYFLVNSALWDRIPAGAHIRYIKKATPGENPSKTRAERFKPGGFVKHHYVSPDGHKSMMIESRLSKPGEGKFKKPGQKQPGHIEFPIRYDNVEEIWKKYDYSSFIEIYLIHNSLAQKKQQLELLEARTTNLENLLRGLVKN